MADNQNNRVEVGRDNRMEIIGASKHNLKDIDIAIPKKKIIAITGVSGSGKSSLAYDTVFQEGQRKYLESLSIYARQFMKSMEKPEVRYIKGISPTISIDQKQSSYYYNSTVGTISDISQYLRLLYARVGRARCPECGRGIETFYQEKIQDFILENFPGKEIQVLAPVVKNRKGIYRLLLERFQKRGFLRARIDGKMVDLDTAPELNRHSVHNIEIVIDGLKVLDKNLSQLRDSISLAISEGDGEIKIISEGQGYFMSDRLYCPNCNRSLKEPQPASFSFMSPLGYCPYCRGLGRDGDNASCAYCGGSGLNRDARAFYFREKNIFELGEMEIGNLLDFLKGVRLDRRETPILEQVYPHIIQRLESFVQLNLDYLALNRRVRSLSGGELQRTRLVSQIGFGLSGIIYILDEPSIGMHMSEQNNLVKILKKLKKRGNTIIVVEHDENTIRSSDYIVDLGPGAGEKGGHLIYSGWFKDFSGCSQSVTADYLFKRKQIELKKGYRANPDKVIAFRDVSINNLERQNVDIPLHALTVVTGVSGSGKSSLVIDAIYPAIRRRLEKAAHIRGRARVGEISGDESIERAIKVDQSSIGKNSRSCPATYIGLMPIIRDFYAGLPEAKARGYDRSRFSFNLRGGRCEACRGMGIRKIEMSFLPELEIQCPVCGGRRYNSETMKVRYRGLSIADLLELTASEAFEFFKNIHFLAKKIRLLNEVGLGYLRLGQSSVTLSGGESQRIKLCKELGRISKKPTLYVLDEPTVGLHFLDIQKLIDVFYSLIAKGNTIVVIEHNPEIIKASDFIVDLGPGGGHKGGQVMYQGKLAGILNCGESVTSGFLKRQVKDAV